MNALPSIIKTEHLAVYWDIFIGFTYKQYTIHGKTKNVQFVNVTYVCEEAKAHQGL